jgi:hypothetical protein
MLFMTLLTSSLLQGQTSTNVLTWHNNNWRNGENNTETILTQSNVKYVKGSSNQFGKICSTATGAIDGQLFAQPLIATGTIPNYNHVVYLVTQNDSVYAIDGDSAVGSPCTVIAKQTLLKANQGPAKCGDIGGKQCGTIAPFVGILGTPVIDTSTNTMYLVTEIESTASGCTSNPPPSCFSHWLHALDLNLTTLTEKYNGPVQIAGSYTAGGNTATFDSFTHIQRPGLLGVPNALPNGHSAVYVAFSMMDGAGGGPNGFVFGYDATNLSPLTAPPYVFATSTAHSARAGVWQSGAGLAAGIDKNGGSTYIYFNTGDGLFDGVSNFGDSFVKLTTTLNLSGFFTPFNQACMLSTDEDFGSGGVMLIPNGVGSSTVDFAVASGKDGNIYVMDRANPGGYNGNPSCTGSNNIVEYFPAATGQFYSTAAFWNQNLYAIANSLALNKYKISSSCSPGPICQTPLATTGQTRSYGPVPAISSNGNTTGTALLWVVAGIGYPNQQSTPGLYAFDAENPTGTGWTPLWNSATCKTRDSPGFDNKFAVPTIANGRVYVGTIDPNGGLSFQDGELDVYGLLTGTTCN